MKNIYVCGPTVYSSPHIGNLRPMIAFDIYRRALAHSGEKVSLINNITDIDDKIISVALKKKVSEESIAKKYEREYLELLDKFNIIRPEHMPKVVENISDSIKVIEKLIETKHAYIAKGDVYFDVRSIKDYGKLSNRSVPEDNEKNSLKKNPGDFALWKKTKEGIEFDAPWGKGRPGWHLECATNIYKLLNGSTLDIHGGGMDLKFPHHENERSIYLALTNKEITKEWKHVGQINFNNSKMSKSEGNIILANDFNNLYGSDTLRYIVITTGVTSPIDLNDSYLEKISKETLKISRTFYRAQSLVKNKKSESKKVKDFKDAIIDWKFSTALRILNESIKDFNRDKSPIDAEDIIQMIKMIGYNFSKSDLTDEEKSWYKKLEEHRENKEFEKADSLYEKMKKRGLV